MENAAELKQLCQNIEAFFCLTGISLQLHSLDEFSAADFPCEFCRKTQPTKQQPATCHALIQNLFNYIQNDAQCGIFFCPAGFCHVLATTALPRYFLLSEAILCTTPNHASCTKVWASLFDMPYDGDLFSHQHSTSFLEPQNITKLARLISTLSPHGTARSFLPQYAQQLARELQTLLSSGNAEWQAFADRVLESILSKTGLNLSLAGFLCTNMIYSLIDSMDFDSYAETGSGLSIPLFIDPTSISTLKQGLTRALQAIVQVTERSTAIRQHTVVNQALNLIHAHYQENITQTAVSKAVYLSPSYFSKVFKDVTGLGFNQYLNEFRVKEAKKLLADPKINLSTVHTLVGFHHQTYFSKIFHRLTGMSPGKYRSLLLS